MRHPTHARRLAPILAVTISLIGPVLARATTYTILVTVDDSTVNGNCTLREALRAARDDAPVDVCPAGSATDTIVLPPGVYPFYGGESLGATGTIRVVGQTGNPFDARVDLSGLGRFLSLSGTASYEIRGVEIANGFAPALESGGAILAWNVTLQMSDFRLVSNRSVSSGGALWYTSTSAGTRLDLRNGTLQSNEAVGSAAGSKFGGGAEVKVSAGATATLRDLAFLDNRVEETGTAIPQSCFGGALYLEVATSGSSGRCLRCIFQSNSVTNVSAADALGGALAVRPTQDGYIEITDSRFLLNSATAVSPWKAVPALASGQFGGWLRADRLLVDFNMASGTTAGVDVYVDADGMSEVSLSNSQITFGTDTGLEVRGYPSVFLGHLTIADYPWVGADLQSLGVNSIHLENSVIALNGTNLVTSGTVLQVTNSVGGDPLFVSPATGDYHLQASSPAIDTGTEVGVFTFELADLDHEPRSVGSATDRGCYELGGLFADDFATGDTGAWSLTQP